jgi:Na+/alanine symporter
MGLGTTEKYVLSIGLALFAYTTILGCRTSAAYART